jgi:hypothetical protein
MPRTARSGGVSGMLHRTTVRRADLIEGTVDSLVRNRGSLSQTWSVNRSIVTSEARENIESLRGDRRCCALPRKVRRKGKSKKNGARGTRDIEGKVTRVGVSKSGGERVSKIEEVE